MLTTGFADDAGDVAAIFNFLHGPKVTLNTVWSTLRPNLLGLGPFEACLFPLSRARISLVHPPSSLLPGGGIGLCSFVLTLSKNQSRLTISSVSQNKFFFRTLGPSPGRPPWVRWTARAWAAPLATSGGVSTGSVVCGDVTSSGTVSAPQLFASNTLTVTNTSDFSDDLTLTKNWAGWSKVQISNNSAASDSGPELPAGQPERAGLPGAGRRGAPARAHHDQRREEPLDAAVPHHEPEEPRLPGDSRQHGQRGLQHQLHQLVGQQGEDGDGRGRPCNAVQKSSLLLVSFLSKRVGWRTNKASRLHIRNNFCCLPQSSQEITSQESVRKQHTPLTQQLLVFVAAPS